MFSSYFFLVGTEDPFDIDPCGEDKPKMISGSTGELTSPNYPLDYPNDADCQWHIKVDDGFTIQLTFIYFNVEDG